MLVGWESGTHSGPWFALPSTANRDGRCFASVTESWRQRYAGFGRPVWATRAPHFFSIVKSHPHIKPCQSKQKVCPDRFLGLATASRVEARSRFWKPSTACRLPRKGGEVCVCVCVCRAAFSDMFLIGLGHWDGSWVVHRNIHPTPSSSSIAARLSRTRCTTFTIIPFSAWVVAAVAGW